MLYYIQACGHRGIIYYTYFIHRMCTIFYWHIYYVALHMLVIYFTLFT